MRKRLTIGVLAHVDAGKTTLSEALLYRCGRIRTQGRVDHGTTFLDHNAIERERGITVFSKQARFSSALCDFVLLDTPGHVDFSAEAERTLALLDYAILVVSAADGVQSHTRTLWQLLTLYQIPTMIFVNKTDLAIRTKEALMQELMQELTQELSPACVPFYELQAKEELDERLALLCEELLEQVLSGEPIRDDTIGRLICERRLFPCLFGSALRMQGIDFLIEAFDRYASEACYDTEPFGARVYKISHSGNLRLTYLKVTSGSLSARDELTYLATDGTRHVEKVNQLRLYSGDKFEQINTAPAGEICAVSGLSATYVGQGLGCESNTCKPILEPVLSYSLRLPPTCDPVLFFPRLKELEEEEPSLHLCRNEENGQIELRLMGEVQVELLKRMILDRFGIDCEPDTGSILYKERIATRTLGIGHFEPLRHYAEVQLLMEPQPAGTGLIFEISPALEGLEVNWQRLILSHLYEKSHRGVLIGAALTDTKITLVAGKAHLKHTDGGDFREATLRAVRHGLMRAGCELLEPYYRFRLELPCTEVGRAISDLQLRHAEFEVQSTGAETAVLGGRAPVATIHDYHRELIAYTHGTGKLTCTPDGYAPCHNAQEVIDAAAYDPEADLANPPHSIFCSHGAGVLIHWSEVEEHKHLNVRFPAAGTVPLLPKPAALAKTYELSDEELEAIMLREFGPIKRRRYSEPRTVTAASAKAGKKKSAPQKRMLIIDGYNVIYAWDSLREIADFSLEKARETLMDLLSDYVAFTKTELTLVFDAYLVKDGVGSDLTRDGYRVVYTKEDQTADAYMERLMHELGPNYNIRLVSGDRLLQLSAVHAGILRMTAKEFEAEITSIKQEIREFIQKLSQSQE